LKLILLTDIPRLGKEGDIGEVKDGYARNFLLPKGMALLASTRNVKVIQQKRERELRKEKEREEELRRLAEQISRTSCTLFAVVGEKDRIFGEITSRDIADALKEKGLEIDKKNIEIKEPIGKLGVYNVKVRLSAQVITDLRVCVAEKRDEH